MVGILEKIRLEIEEDRFISVNNPFNEKSQDYICRNVFDFKKGKIYGVICEHGGGGEAISLLLTNEVSLDTEKVYFDDKQVEASDIKNVGWYVGKPLYSKFFIKTEISVRKALNYAINKYHKYEKIDEIINEFHLTPSRLDYGLSRNCEWEKWRASLAIGYASNRRVYCFPWMDSLCFYDCMINSAVYCFFKKLKNEGAIIILPTSRVENINGLVDEVIQIHSPRFEHMISENPYFKEYF